MMETLVNSLKKENISYNPIDLRMAEEDEIKKNLESREFLSDYSGKSIQSFIHSFVCYSFSPYRFRLTTLWKTLKLFSTTTTSTCGKY
mgnify:CR=1 FL=1